MRIKRRYIIIIAILIFVVLLDRMLIYRTRKADQREKAFISKVIDSVNDGTDFHKKYINNDDVSRIKPFISKNYEIAPPNFGSGISVYCFIFDKKFEIWIDFEEINGDYYISIKGIDWYDNNKE